MPYLKSQKKKYKLNFNWRRLEELEQKNNADPMNPYYTVYTEWLRSNGLKSDYDTEEIFRKCYSIYNSKKELLDEINLKQYRLGVLQNRIDECQEEIDNINCRIEKLKYLYKMTIKPTNYEKFHYTWNSIVDMKPTKKRQRVKKTEEFIMGYLLENDKLFNRVVVARKLMGKGL